MPSSPIELRRVFFDDPGKKPFGPGVTGYVEVCDERIPVNLRERMLVRNNQESPDLVAFLVRRAENLLKQLSSPEKD